MSKDLSFAINKPMVITATTIQDMQDQVLAAKVEYLNKVGNENRGVEIQFTTTFIAMVVPIEVIAL